MKHTSFLVHRVRFEVDLCGGQEGAAFEEGLVALLRERVLPVFESVLGGFFSPSGAMTIRELIVDLGEVTVGEAEELLPRRFEARLMQALMKSVEGEDRAGRVPWAGDDPQGESRWRLGRESQGQEKRFARALKKLLVYGREERNLACVKEGWQEHPGVVRETYFAHAHDRNVPRNAAQYLDKTQLKGSAVILSPEHGDFAGGVIEKTAEDRILLKNTAPVPGDADGFERQLWEFTLGYMLVEGRGRFERKQYVSSLVSRIASHENINAAALLDAFQVIFLRVNGGFGLEVRGILAELVLETSGVGGRDTTLRKQRDDEEARFHTSLERVLRGKGTSADLMRVVRGMGRGGGNVRGIVLREGRRADVRANMVKYFSHEQLEILVGALGPEEAATGRFISHCLAHRPAIQAHTSEVKSREVFSNQLWELSLAFLLVERKSRFNFKRYLQHLISGMAARYNMAYGSLLVAFREVYTTRSGKKEQDELALLDELWMEENKGGRQDLEIMPEADGVERPVHRQEERTAGKDNGGPWSLPLHKDRPRATQDDAARELMTRLQNYLAGGHLPDGMTCPGLLESLKKENSVLFMRWARELQGRPEYIRLMAETLGKKELAPVLIHLIAGLTMVPAESLHRMIRAGFAAAEQEGGGGAAYAEVIAGLLQGGPQGRGAGLARKESDVPTDAEGDLEVWQAVLRHEGGELAAKRVAALASKATGEGAQKAEALLSAYRRFVREGENPQPSLLRLARFLDASGPPDSGYAVLCSWDIRRALSGKPRALKTVLEGCLTSWIAACRLAGNITEHDAARIIGIIAPSWVKTVLPVLDALMLGVASAGRASTLGKWKYLIWAWTFQQVATRSAVPMPAEAFLHSLLSWMARHSGRELLGDLLACVSSNIRPDTEGALRPVVESIHARLHGLRGGEARNETDGPGMKVVGEQGIEAEKERGTRGAMAGVHDDTVPLLHPDHRYDVVHEGGSDEEACWVENAGLVILSPYLPALFSRLGYLENGRFIDKALADRAALLLDYLARKTKESPDTPLIFNRLLCGTISEGRHLEKVTLAEKETAMAEELLRAVVANWKALKNTSPDGLRESFLAREGELRLKEGAWDLKILPRAWDILLDRLPWGITPIKHPWMTQGLYVHWRENR